MIRAKLVVFPRLGRGRLAGLAVVARALLFLGVGCSAEADRAADRADNIGSAVASLSSNPSCFTTAAHQSITGGGEFITPSDYNPTTCPRGFLIDLTNYATSNNLGTFVAYGGSTPTTAAACDRARVTAYVWRRESSGAGTFLTSAETRGIWNVDFAGRSFCLRPSMNLERVIPNYQANNTADYRVAIQARLNDPAPATTAAFQSVHFATVGATYQRPVDLYSQMDSLRASLVANPTRVSKPVDKVWSIRNNSTLKTAMCRASELRNSFETFTKPSLLRVGASSAALDARTTAANRMHTAICGTTPGSFADFQTGMKDYFQATIDIRNGIRAQLDSRFPSGTDTTLLASNILVETMRLDLGVLVGRCGVSPTPLLDFLRSGTLPTGVNGARLILGSCSTSPSQGASEVAAALGMGSNVNGLSASAARDAVRQCMMRNVGGNPQDICNDPRAQGNDASQELDGKPDAKSELCSVAGVLSGGGELLNCPVEVVATDEGVDMQVQLDDLKAKQDAKIAELRQRLADAEVSTNRANQEARREQAADDRTVVAIGAGAWGATALAVGVSLAGPEALVGAVAVGSVTLVAESVGLAYLMKKAYDSNLADVVRRVNDRTSCIFGNPTAAPWCVFGNQMCGPDMGFNAWYANSGDARQLNKADRLDHCLCEILDARYAAFPSVTGASSSACPSYEDHERQNCLTDPSGDDGHPRRFECLKHLRPGPLDSDAWKVKICNAAQCPANKIALTLQSGACDCINPVTDASQGLPCRQGTAILCNDASLTTCGCVPLDSGSAPIGDDPLCRYATTAERWPGSIDAFSVEGPGDVFAHQHNATDRFAMIRPDASGVSPAIFKNSLPAIPIPSSTNQAKLRLKALSSRVPAGNLALQVYFTTFGPTGTRQALNHDYMGEINLNTLQPGMPTTVDVPLNQSLLDRAFAGTGLRIEYTVQAPDGYGRFVGVGAQSFTGATASTPANLLAPDCPRPTPDNGLIAIPGINPAWRAGGGTVINPTVLFALGTGANARIPSNITVLRELAASQ